MFAHMRFVIILSVLFTGGFSSKAATGGSDANARLAKESISKFTHKS
jgi:hypothetical protein